MNKDVKYPMNKYKAISKETRASNKALASFIVLGGVVFSAVVLGAILSPDVEFSSSIIFMAILAVTSFVLAAYVWQVDKELTKEAKTWQKAKSDALLLKWYVRYPLSILYCGIAYLGFLAWQQNLYPSGVVMLLVNPITAVICAIMALASAWELSLTILAIGVVYIAFLGVASLPVSVSIIIGATLIATAVYSRRL